MVTENRGSVAALQRALDSLGLDSLAARREIDGWLATVEKVADRYAGGRYSSKAKRLEDAVRAALRDAAAGGKSRGDPNQLALGTVDAKPLTLSLPSGRREWTVGEGQDFLESIAEEGAACPCCGQRVQLYRRKLNSNMVVFLITLVLHWQANGGARVHYSECRFTGRDYSVLANFGLARTFDADENEPSRTSGLWEPTREGVDFAFDRLRVRQYALIFDNRVIGYAGEKIGVREALGSAFDYAELMKGA